MKFGRNGLVMLGLIFAGPAQATSLEDIVNRGTLNACVSAIDPALVRKEPQGCTSQCIFSGLVVDQVRAYAASLETVTPVFREIGWSEHFENIEGIVDRTSTSTPRLLQNGDCDVFASNLARLPWRLNMMEIVPLFESRMIVLTHRDRLADFPNRNALAGKSVAVTYNSSFHSWMLDQNAGVFADNPMKIEALGGREAIQLVISQDVDFTLLDADISVFSMNAFATDLAPAFAVGPVQKLGWGLAKDNTDLAASIAEFFEAERADNRSALNQAWLRHLNVSITEFEALVETMGDPNDEDADGK